ncbi:class I SAM-dependent methyltransferase [Fibrella forsythiae]|uniref:Class I SAM-dependent methyltransferase n=1 Tax=Fibrella forsythiae TaxID=2817061 RepID=A0ABS3JM04_9BACT|nr:class I SAM-dependent methyltransferase [Fibrella forsythiae]MBO0951035.1 class I SAM-dependent methyltransferase [Fibrella forsythiae]
MSKENHPILPPPYNRQSDQHPVFPSVSHDEAARFNFLTNLNKYVSSVAQPGIRIAYERRVRPPFNAQKGRDFATHNELKSAMLPEPCFQAWGALYRSTVEMRQQASRSLVLKQLDTLASKASQYSSQRPETLHLDPSVSIPTYLTVTDNHAMPGGYYTEYRPDDVSSAATYDLGLIVKHAHAEGQLSDGMGRAVVAWLKQNYPNFAPTRILDLGCGPGNNTLPLAIGYPTAQVTGIDVSAPMLRYSHARSVALNVPNVDFSQVNAEQLPYDDESVDWVQTTSFLHETSKAALEQIIREIHRVLKPGGLMLHLEQSPYTPDVHLFEQCVRDWKAQLDNMPFRTIISGMGMKNWMISGGFDPDDLLQFSAAAVADSDDFTQPTRLPAIMPAVSWNVFGAWKGTRSYATQ